MTRLRLDSAARAELLHETKYYEATRPGTGRRFREAVDEAFERIKRAPKEVPGVNCQEASRAELLESLRLTLSEALEHNRAEARSVAGGGYEELPIAV